MAAQNSNVEKDPEVSIEQALGRSEQFLERNGRKLLIALIAVIVVVGGYFAYQNIYVSSRSEKASEAMFRAQMSFEVDSFAMALKGLPGPQGFLGFEDISAEYGGTEQGNLAHHYAGICYLRMGDFQTALASFEKFSNISGVVGEVVAAQNIGLMGDCYSEMGDAARACEFYAKAAAASSSDAVGPIYLHKAAISNYMAGKFDIALEQFTQIKTQYPRSMNARDIDKYIALVQQKL